MTEMHDALGLPAAAIKKLMDSPRERRFRLMDGLAHPLRRQVIREIHFADIPRSVGDLCGGEVGRIRSVQPRALEYHVGLLAEQGILNSIGEVVTGRGVEPLFLSTVAADDTVSGILVETAELDLRWIEGFGARETLTGP